MVRLDTDEILYSKLETKRQLVGTKVKKDGVVVHDDAPFEAWCAEKLASLR